MSKIRPLSNRVVILRSEEEAKSPGGIYMPETVKGEKPMEGTVVSVGKGKRDANGNLCPMDVKEGNRVLFGKYAGNEVKINEEEYLIMSEDDIMGVIED